MMNLESPIFYLDQASLNRLADKYALDSYLRQQQQKQNNDTDFRMVVSPRLKNNLMLIMQRLNKTEQEILRLRYWEDFSLFEIGHALGIEESAVKRRLTKTLAKLRQKIMGSLTYERPLKGRPCQCEGF